MDLLTELESLIPELEKGLDQASSLQEMEALRVEFLGRKGRIARIMSRLPELDTIGDRKTALFVIISDTDDTFNFVVSILYTQLFNLL